MTEVEVDSVKLIRDLTQSSVEQKYSSILFL